MFIFTALALIKRHTELAALLDANLPDLTNRNYLKSDLDIVAILAAVSAFNGITVFALYISSDTVHNLYKQPKLLWLICPILMYWIGRILIMSHRRLMHEDPVVFALKDRNSLLVGCLIGIILIGAITL
jgi:4-hydroxybenzoate polyprenyltransferase